MSIEILSAEYKNSEGTLIDVTFKHPTYGVIPYTYDSTTKNESYDAEIAEALKSYTETITAYTEPTLSDEQLKNLYKSYYLVVWDAKLVELDYDSIATISMWANKTDSSFYEEATALLNWYEAITNKNYEILNAVSNSTKYVDTWVAVTPTKAEYLAALPSWSDYAPSEA